MTNLIQLAKDQEAAEERAKKNALRKYYESLRSLHAGSDGVTGPRVLKLAKAAGITTEQMASHLDVLDKAVALREAIGDLQAKEAAFESAKEENFAMNVYGLIEAYKTKLAGPKQKLMDAEKAAGIQHQLAVEKSRELQHLEWDWPELMTDELE